MDSEPEQQDKPGLMALTETFERELIEWATRIVGTESVWGESDCIMLGIQARDIVLGLSDYDNWFEMWTSEATAREYAKLNPVATWLAANGATRIDFNFAMIGDVLITSDDDYPARCHVCLGEPMLSGTPGQTITLLNRWVLKDLNPVVWRLY